MRRVVVLLVALALGGGVMAHSAQPAGRQFRLGVQLHEVTLDAKGRQLAARQITGAAAGETPEAVVAEVARWITERLGQVYDLKRPRATVRLRVPADPSREPLTIDKTGEAAVNVLLYILEPGPKARVPADPVALAAIRRDFDLEISAAGYTAAVRRIRWGQALDETIALYPTALQVGVEDFPGDPALGARLAETLGQNSRVHIKPPATLATLRSQIDAGKALLARNPGIQMLLRQSLGVDVLISGRYDVR